MPGFGSFTPVHLQLPGLSRRSETACTNSATSDEVTLWLFLVADGIDGTSGTPALAASGEEGGKGIYVARFDPLDAASVAAVSWTLLLDANADLPVGAPVDITETEITSAQGFADHWHIYAHGYHWIAASVTAEGYGGISVVLVKFTIDAAGVPTIAWTTLVKEPTAKDDWNTDEQLKHPTNDLFLVTAGHGGVAIGLRHNEKGAIPTSVPPDAGGGHIIIEVWGDGTLQPEISFSPVGSEHGNCASASRTTDVGGALTGVAGALIYRVLAPEISMSHIEGDLLLIEADKDWNGLRLTRLRSRTDMNYQMASEASLGNGQWAMTYKRTDITKIIDVGDDGDPTLAVLVTDVNGWSTFPEAVTSTATSTEGERPHIIYWQGALIVTWDGGGQAWVTVFDLDWNPAKPTIADAPDILSHPFV